MVYRRNYKSFLGNVIPVSAGFARDRPDKAEIKGFRESFSKDKVYTPYDIVQILIIYAANTRNSKTDV